MQKPSLSLPAAARRSDRLVFVSNAASFGVTAIAGVVVSALLAARFGVDAVGQFNQLAAIQLVFSQLAAFGFHLACLHYLSVHPYGGAEWVAAGRSALALTGVTATITAGALFSSAGLLESLLDSPGLGEGVRWVALAAGLFGLNKVLFALLTAAERFHTLALAQALRPLGWLAGAATLLRQDAPQAASLGQLLAMAEVLTLLGAGTRVLPFLFRSAAPGAGGWYRKHYSFAWRAMPSNLLIDLNTRVDVLVLGFFASDGAVGIYSFAALVAEGVFQIGTIVRTMITPRLVRALVERDAGQLASLRHGAGRASLVLTAVSALALAVVYTPAVRLFGLDPALAQGLNVLLILLAGVVATSFHSPFWMALAMGGRPGEHTQLMLLVVVCSVALNLALTPWAGITGAAIATATTFAAVPLMLRFAVRRTLGMRI